MVERRSRWAVAPRAHDRSDDKVLAFLVTVLIAVGVGVVCVVLNPYAGSPASAASQAQPSQPTGPNASGQGLLADGEGNQPQELSAADPATDTEQPAELNPLANDATADRGLEPPSPPEPATVNHLDLLGDRLVARVGFLDGKPELAQLRPSPHEFTTTRYAELSVDLGDSALSTRFPYQVRPGQEVTFTWPGLPREDLRFRTRVVAASDKLGHYLSFDRRILEVQVNNRSIWRRGLPSHSFNVTALVPADWLNGSDDRVTIRNLGRIPLSFDALWLERQPPDDPLYLATRERALVPPDCRHFFAPRTISRAEYLRLPYLDGVPAQILACPHRRFANLVAQGRNVFEQPEAVWYYRSFHRDAKWQEQVARLLAEQLVGWYSAGGNGLWLENLFENGHAFCPRTGEPFPSGHILARVLSAFRGECQRIPVNVLPNTDHLHTLHWVGIRNREDMISILIAPNVGEPVDADKQAVVQCRLPWAGEAEVTLTDGLFPAEISAAIPPNRIVPDRTPEMPYDQPRRQTTRRRRLTGTGASLFNEKITFRNLALIQLLRPGAEPVPLGPRECEPAPALVNTVAARALSRIRTKRESGVVSGQPIPLARVWTDVLGPSCQVETAKATKGRIGAQQYVYPTEPQSLFMAVRYGERYTPVPEGVALRFRDLAAIPRNQRLCFWVYPHVTDPRRRTASLGVLNGNQAFTLELKANQWQQVRVTPPETPPEARPAPRRFVVHGTRGAFGQGDEDTFEFNGFRFEDRAAAEVRGQACYQRDGRLYLLLGGKPGATATVHHFFDEPVTVKAVSLGPDLPLQWTYDQGAQALEITELTVGDRPTPGCETLCARQDLAACRDRGLIPQLVQVTCE